MKTQVLILVLILLPCIALSQKTKNKGDSSLKTNGVILVSSNGFAPVPAFAFGKPMVIALLSVRKGRFTYEPNFALGFDGQSWLINQWLRYRLLEYQKFTLVSGINLSLFFNNKTLPTGKERIIANRNVTFEAVGRYQISKKSALSFRYQYNRAFDQTITGHLIELTGSVSSININKSIALNLKLQLFYFNHLIDVDGLFTFQNISITYTKIPVGVFFQSVQPIWANFSRADFKWSAGVYYSF